MQVRLNSTLRGTTGQRDIELDLPEGATVRQALEAAVARIQGLSELLFTPNGALQPNVVIFYNGRNIQQLDGLSTLVEATTTLSIFPRTGAQRAFAMDEDTGRAIG